MELVSPRGAPLRAWVRTDHRVRPGTVPLDELGQRVLGLRPGDRVHIRRL